MPKDGLQKPRKKFRNQFLAGSLLIAIIPCAVLFLWNVRSMRQFYTERVRDYQTNQLQSSQEKLSSITERAVNAADSVIGLMISNSQFEEYTGMSDSGRIQLMRAIRSELSSLVITYQDIDSICMAAFDGTVFTSNTVSDVATIADYLGQDLSPEQAGRTVVLPPHEAPYKSARKNADHYPYVISYRRYLNRFTPGSAIGLVQIDIAYQTIEKALSAESMTDSQYAFVLDADGNIIFAPDREGIGKPAEAGRDSGGRAAQIAEIAEHMADSRYYADGNVIANKGEEKNFGWSVILVSKDDMVSMHMRAAVRKWIIITLLCILAAIVLAYFLSYNIGLSMHKIIGLMLEASDGNFEVDTRSVGNNEFSVLAQALNQTMGKIDALMKKNIRSEHEKTAMELEALSSKINSHFLYNTLNLVKMVAIRNHQDEIARIIVALSNILEYSFRDLASRVELSREVAFTKDYAFIQSVRFRKQVEIDYEIEDSLRDYPVPKLILQPIVENSMLHAFEENDEENRILVSAQKIRFGGQEMVEIYIEDNGKGFEYEGLNKLTGFGLRNVIQRLEIFYPDQFSYDISSKPNEGTVVIFRLPAGAKEDGKNAGAAGT